MLSHRNFRAWITSEGNKLPIYEPRVDHGKNTVTCWIEAEEGKNFAVNWEDLGTGIDSAAYITLDGFKVPGRYLFGKGIAWRTGVRTGPSTERPFAFARVDGGAPAEDARRVDVRASQFGMIILRVRQIARVDDHSTNPVRLLPNSMRGKRESYSLCVKLGPEVPTAEQPPTSWAFKPHDKAHPGSYATFIFRYRSRAFLESQGLRPVEMGIPGSTADAEPTHCNARKRKAIPDNAEASRNAEEVPAPNGQPSKKRQRSSSVLTTAPHGTQHTRDSPTTTSPTASSISPTPSCSSSQDSFGTVASGPYSSEFQAIVAVLQPCVAPSVLTGP